jgi:hypothetical protein
VVITPERIADLRKLAEAATPGPWEKQAAAIVGKGADLVFDCSVSMPWAPDDADHNYLAAVSPLVVTELLDEVERLREDVRAIKSASADLAEWRDLPWPGESGGGVNLLCWLGLHNWTKWHPPEAKYRLVALHKQERDCRRCRTREYK